MKFLSGQPDSLASFLTVDAFFLMHSGGRFTNYYIEVGGCVPWMFNGKECKKLIRPAV